MADDGASAGSGAGTSPSNRRSASGERRRAADGAAPLLAMRGISKTFGGVRALRDVDFSVATGEVHCLAGENGSGKSTLIKIVTGVHRADDGGHIEIAGQTVQAPTPALARRLGIGVIWQDLALFPELDVAENIAVDALASPWPRPVRRAGMREQAAAALDRLGIDLPLDAPLRTLAIGERQIVAIARAIAGDARLLFMDEPTASLTQSETDVLLDIVRGLSERDVGVVFVSHRLAEVLEISSAVTVLRDGALVGVYETDDMTQSRLSELMTGESHDSTVAARDIGDAPAVLELQGLSRAGEFEDIDLTVRRGEIVGLIGLIGAGRTELAHAIFGMTRPERGTMALEGKEVRFRDHRGAIDAGVAYISEDRLSLGLVQPQSIADNLALPVLDRLRRLAFLSNRKQDELVEHWVERLSVRIGEPEDAVTTLSGGNQQRIVIAKWLATEPTLLICDAPTVGVDVGARAGIFRIIRELAESGLAILLISDEASEVHFNSDRVLVMADGRIAGTHDPRTDALDSLEQKVYG